MTNKELETAKTVKMQFYHMDGGKFHNTQHISRMELNAIRLAEKGPIVIEVSADDWHSNKLPKILNIVKNCLK